MESIKKIHSRGAILLATFLGGPLAAGYLIMKNYEGLDQPENARKALLIGLMSTIVLFGGVLILPDYLISKIPSAVIPASCLGGVYAIVENTQGAILKNHKQQNGVFYSCWIAVGVGIVSLLIVVAVVSVFYIFN